MAGDLVSIKSEIIRIKEAVRVLRTLKSLEQYDFLKELEDLIVAFEKQPILETARDIEEFKYKKEIAERKRTFESIFTYEISVFGDRINLDRLLGKLRNAIIRYE